VEVVCMPNFMVVLANMHIGMAFMPPVFATDRP